MDNLGFVYFVQCVETRRIKIGYTEHVPDRRIRTIQAMCSGQLEKLGLMRGDVADEVRLHERFATHRLHGEWFCGAPEILEFIKAEAGDWGTVAASFKPKKVAKPVRRTVPKPPAQKLVTRQVAEMQANYARRLEFESDCWMQGVDPNEPGAEEKLAEIFAKLHKRGFARRVRLGLEPDPATASA